MGHEVSLQRKAQNVVSTLVSAGLYIFDIGSQRLTCRLVVCFAQKWRALKFCIIECFTYGLLIEIFICLSLLKLIGHFL